MRAADVLRSVFPPPRRPVTVWTVLPPAAFLAVYGGLCFYLAAADVMLFTAPKAFFLLAFVPWAWWLHTAGHSGLRGWRSMLALLTRLTLIGVMVMLLAEPRSVRISDVLTVVYVLDRSDSIGEGSSDRALEYIVNTVSQKPEKDEAGLVVFGRRPAVELPPRTVFPFEAINSRLATDGTDLAKGLSLAAAMVPEENPGRIVLVSDGVATAGDLGPVLGELKDRGIPVDVLAIEYSYDREVWLEKLELPRFIEAGESYEAAVVLSSLKAGTGTLVLQENGRTIYEGQVEFGPGKERFVLPIHLREAGFYHYVATISVPAGMDGWSANNRAVNHLYLEGEGKILIVTDPNGPRQDWLTLSRALTRAEFAVETVVAYEFPRDSLSLMPYDCIILPNVPADAFDLVQMQALHDAVHSQGTGCLMIGGKNSFGPGGYHRTPVEKVLPVSMDIEHKKVLPKAALVIILHTCEFPEGNTWGKRVAKEAIRVLGARDEVGVLAYTYDGAEQWVFNLTPAGEYERLVTLINKAQIGDMPSFQNTMQMGLDALKASDAAVKHMIIISDGDPSPPTPALMKSFAAEEISVSTVAVFPHGGMDVPVMQSIANLTGGRFYYPQDPSLLPSIFIKEAKTLKRNMIRNVTFTPTFVAPSPIMKGLDKLPALHAYVLTTAKPRSFTILRGPETDQMDPVLATWRYGVGKTAVFTSDLSPNWGSDWVQWDRYQAFVKQLVADISRTRREGYLDTRTVAAGGSGVIIVEDTHPEGHFLQVEAVVTGPQRRTETLRLTQTGPRRYEGSFPLWGKGQYQIVVAGVGDGRSEQQVSGFIVPYSPEYLRFRSNPAVLSSIAQKTGGRVLTGEETGETLFSKQRQPKASSQSVADLFLLVLACLLPFDVGVRRIQLDWSVIKGWLGMGRKDRTSIPTLDALLKRKSEIKFAGAEEGGAGAHPAAPAVRRPRPSTPKPTPPPVSEPTQDEDQGDMEGLSTTERLLRLRQMKRQKDASEEESQ